MNPLAWCLLGCFTTIALAWWFLGLKWVLAGAFVLVLTFLILEWISRGEDGDLK